MVVVTVAVAVVDFHQNGEGIQENSGSLSAGRSTLCFCSGIKNEWTGFPKNNHASSKVT
jgi:hypothetical protein